MTQPCKETITHYIAALFEYLEGWIALRSFAEAGASGKPVVEWIPLNQDSAALAYDFACRAHAERRACYLIPGTVSERGKAGSQDVTQFGTLLIDIDNGDTEAKLAHLTRHIGAPNMVIASGGITEEGKPKLHLYWRLSEAATDDDIATVLSLREQMALKVGGDTHFKSAHQPIRIAGSIYHKHGEPKPVVIQSETAGEYHLGDLIEAVNAMPPLPSIAAPQASLNWQDYNNTRPSIDTILTSPVREGGKDGYTRFEALSAVIGHYIYCVHNGYISQEEAWNGICGFNLAQVKPSWSEDRLKRETERLWRKHCRENGPAKAPATAGTTASDIKSYRLGELLDDQSPMPDDLISPRVLTPGGMLVFGGAPKVGKSDFLLSMFIHLAAGEPFLSLTPTRPLRIFYIQAEVGYDYLRERIHDLSVSEDIKQRAAERLRMTPQARFILNEATVIAFIEHIQFHFGQTPPDIICIDPLRNVFDGGEQGSENDNSAMLTFLKDRVERMRDAVNPNAGIILVHHTKKIHKKLLEEDPFQAFSGAGSLRSYYTSGMMLFKPDEYAQHRQLFFELRNGPGLEPRIVDKVNGQWIERSILNDRLVGKDHGRKLDAERRRKRSVILQLLFDEARAGHIYTGNQFAEKFENKAGLGSKKSIEERLSVLATKGYLRFFRNYEDYGLDYSRSRYGYLCVEDMEFLTPDGELIPVLPTHYKAASSGACLEVENPHVWTYQEEEEDE